MNHAGVIGRVIKPLVFLFFVIFFPIFVFGADYYVSTSGDDGNDGTDPAFPLRNIQTGINKSVGTGDNVIISPGTYYEVLKITNKNGLTVKSNGAGEVVVDAAVEALATSPSGEWTYEGQRYGTYPQANFDVYYAEYTPKDLLYVNTYYIPGFTIADKDNSDNLLFTYSGRDTFEFHHVKAADGAGGYFTYDSGTQKARVYLASSTDPNSRNLNISSNTYVVWLADGNENITLDDLTLSHGGRFGILLRSFSEETTNGPTLKNLKIINSVAGIIFYSSKAVHTNVLIENNYLERKLNTNWGWADIKECDTSYASSTDFVNQTGNCRYDRVGDEVVGYSGGQRSMEGGAIELAYIASTDAVVHDNEIIGFHDGIKFSGTSLYGACENSEVYNNTITTVQDDGLEFVGGSTNNNVHDNIITGAAIGLSNYALHTGPSYFYENIFINNRVIPWYYKFDVDEYHTWAGSGTKMYSGSGGIPDNSRIYYNTFYSNQSNSVVSAIDVTDFQFANNIFYSESSKIVGTSGLRSNEVYYKSNVFYSGRDCTLTGQFNFTDWNGTEDECLFANLTIPSGWTNNQEVDPVLAEGDLGTPLTYFQLTADSPARTANGMTLESLTAPAGASAEIEASISLLNNRTSAGALEYTPSLELPYSPTDLTQYKSDGVTEISSGGWTDESSAILKFNMSSPNDSDLFIPGVEIIENGSAFSNIANFTGPSYEFSGAEVTGSVTVSGLVSGSTYHWQSIVSGTAGDSSWVLKGGNPDFGVDSDVPSTPGIPSTTSPTTDTTPLWNWTASTDGGSGLADPAYMVEWSLDSGFLTGVSSAPSSVTSYTHSTVLDDGTWYIRVKATDLVGNPSLYSSNGSVEVDATPPSTPGIPSTTSPTTDTTPLWNWTASTDLGVGLSNPAYTIQWCQDGGYTGCDSNTGTSNTNSFTHLIELGLGTWYTRIQARDLLNNASSWSGNGSVLIEAPEVVISVTLSPVTPDPTSDSTPLATGTADVSPGTISTVEYNIDTILGLWTACSADDSTFDEASEDFTCVLEELEDGAHTVYVRALDNDSNYSSNSTDGFTVDTTPPSTPGIPSTTSPTTDTTPLWNWTASTDGGSGLADPAYMVEWSLDSGFLTGVSSAPSSVTSYTHSTVLDDGTWYIRVKATDLVGNPSLYSSNGSVETESGTFNIFSISATPSNNNANVVWTTDAAASSQVDYGLIPYASTTVESDTISRVTSHTVRLTGLSKCKTYHYRVRGKNESLIEVVAEDATFKTTGCSSSSSRSSSGGSKKKSSEIINGPITLTKINSVNIYPIVTETSPYWITYYSSSTLPWFYGTGEKTGTVVTVYTWENIKLCESVVYDGVWGCVPEYPMETITHRVDIKYGSNYLPPFNLRIGSYVYSPSTYVAPVGTTETAPLPTTQEDTTTTVFGELLKQQVKGESDINLENSENTSKLNLDLIKRILRVIIIINAALIPLSFIVRWIYTRSQKH